ncbi:hypothetical protein C3K47_01800 [Solitalea longa]|uniref:Glycosyl transferase family 1 domain-containing protein n=1 Tax=Solitalea longa TaxID=2079460 RepID=A0A2S5AAX9_9SPHI|nr:glycosyltransferase [Solitalea longa]POY39253.1 hypothetical protein C3K47_01800 [Solitalea longa]
MKKKLLFITGRNLLPADSGDKLFSYNVLLNLLKGDVEVYLIYFNQNNEEDNVRMLKHSGISSCKEVYHINYNPKNSIKAIIGSVLTQVSYPLYKWRNKKMKGLISEIISREKIDIVVWDHLRTTANFADNNAKNILIEHNNESEILKKRASEKNNSFYFKWFALFSSFLMEKHINKYYEKMHKVIFISEYDYSFGGQHKTTIELLRYLNLKFAHQAYQFDRPKVIEPLKLLFVGSLDWYPNVNGIKWFVNNVLGNLRNTELWIVGRNPTDEIMSLNNDKVKVFANVPSVEEYFLKADIFICPIFEGGGINIKILEALSYGIPLVATDFALRGYECDFIPTFDTVEECEKMITAFSDDVQLRKVFSIRAIDYYNNYIENSEGEILELILN